MWITLYTLISLISLLPPCFSFLWKYVKVFRNDSRFICPFSAVDVYFMHFVAITSLGAFGLEYSYLCSELIP